MLAYLPRFLVAVAAVPAVFTAVLLGLTRLDIGAHTYAAVAGAITFAAVSLAPSTKNALLRAALLLAVVAIVLGILALTVGRG